VFSGADFPDPSTPDGAVALAEALAGAYICPGVPGVLELKTRVATLRLTDLPPAWNVPQYGEYRLPVRWLRDAQGQIAWPITGVSAVNVDGADVTSSCTWTMFAIHKDRRTAPFLPLSTLTVTYQTGWVNPGDVPPAIKQAVGRLAGLIRANPAGVKRRRLEYLEAEYLPWSAQTLPPEVRLLLDPYRLVEFGG
jgi:hypothetical protein